MIKYYPVRLEETAAIVHCDPLWLSGAGRLLPFTSTPRNTSRKATKKAPQSPENGE